MKTKTALLVILLAFALMFANVYPSRAQGEEPPADVAADIITLAPVDDIYPGDIGSNPSDMAVYGNTLFFAAESDNGIGRELWIYDAALPLSSTNPLAYDVCLGPASSSPTDLTVYNGELYFVANGCDGAGDELWKFTWANGAKRVADVIPGNQGSGPTDLTVYGTNLFFSAFGNSIGRELWIYNAALPVSSTNPGSFDICIGSGSSSPISFAVYNGALYFGADGCDGAGKELWKFTGEMEPNV